MQRTQLLALLATVTFLSGCASTSYSDWEGSPVYQGHGGAKKVVNGIELWTDGTPPRTFRIVGVITDERNKAVIPMASFHSDIANLAKKHGGDAAIIVGSSVENVATYFTPATTTGVQTGTIQTYGNTGYYSGSSSYTSSGHTAVNVRRQTAKVIVIKYEQKGQ